MDRFGRYLVRGNLGTGAMGVVLDAVDPALNRPVAIKVLRHQDGHVSEERLRREAQALARVQHPNVIHVYEAGSERGQLYVVMERVVGESLDVLIRRRAPRERLLHAVEQAARGLHAAHQAGVLHRDVKPANILVDQGTNRARVADFGLAHLDGALTLTREGAVLGTPSYTAPELAGVSSSRPGPWSDVYGLGATLFEVLTGRVPYPEPETLFELVQVLASSEPAPAPCDVNPAVPRALSLVCQRAIAKRAEDRFPDAGAFADALAAARVPPTRLRNALVGILVGLVAILGAREVQRLVATGPAGGGTGEVARVTTVAPPVVPRTPVVEPVLDRSLSEGDVLGVSEGRHADAITRCVIVSGDGRRVASAGEDAMRVWDAATGAPIFVAPVPKAIGAFAGRHGERLVTSSLEGEVVVWDLQVGTKVASMHHLALARRGHAGETLASDDAGRYAVWSNGRLARLVDLNAKAVILLHRGNVLSVAITPDGQRALVGAGGGGESGVVEGFDVARVPTERKAERDPIWTIAPFANGSARFLAVSPEGTDVIAASNGGRASFARWALGASKASLAPERGVGRATAIAFGPGPSLLVAKTHQGGATGYRWSTRIEQPWTIATGDDVVALSPDGRTGFIAAGAALRCVRLDDGSVVWGGESGHAGPVTALARVGDGVLLSAGRDGTLRAWDLDSGRDQVLARDAAVLGGLSCFAPSRRAMCAGACARVAEIGSTTAITEIATPCSAVAMLPGGDRYAAIRDRSAWIASLSGGAPVALVRSGTGVLSCIAAGGDRIAAADRTGAFEAWDAGTGELSCSLALGGGASSLSMSRDGRFAVVCVEGQPPRVIDLEAGRAAGILGNAAAGCAAISPDGTLAAAGDGSGMIWLWAVRSGRRLSELDVGRLGHVAAVLDLGDRELLVGTERGAILRLKVR